MKRSWKWLLVLVIAAIGVLLLIEPDWMPEMPWSRDENTGPGASLTTRVTRGPMIISVREFCDIEAGKRTVISNELEWSVIIKSVVEQGTLVKKGDVIIEFECKALEDAIDNKDLEVDAAKLAWQQAEKNLELKQKSATNEIQKAENVLTLARENLQKYKDKGGQWEIDLNDAESNIQLAQQQLKLAEEKLAFKEQVNKDKTLKSPYSKNEIEADKLSVQQLELNLKNARSSKQMLIKYDYPQQLRQLQEEVDQAEIDMERTKLEKEIEITLFKSELATKKMKLDKLREKLAELKEDKSKLIVRAEQQGLVIYDVGGSRWQPSEVEVKVSEQIGPRQRLMKIPDMTTLEIETEIFEALVSQIHARGKENPGTEALIRLDSIPGKIIHGRVRWISPLPKHSGPSWMKTGTKVYELKIEPDWQGSGLVPGEDLKPDMNGEVELILEQLDDVLTIPISSVFSRGDRYYCLKVTDGQVLEREITIGKMNDTRVHVLSGLNEGDEVLLTADQTTDGEGKGKSAGTNGSEDGTRSAGKGN